MKPPDVWEKGTGHTRFKGSDRCAFCTHAHTRLHARHDRWRTAFCARLSSLRRPAAAGGGRRAARSYDTVPPPDAAGGKRVPSVSDILAPVYVHGRGPPSYESTESFDKGPMSPR
jgi:hypothetical protein